MTQRHISPERKTLYYIGMALAIVGAISFASTFFTFMWHFGDFSNFESNARSDGFRAFGGMVLMIVGSIVMGIGAKGAAGSGLKLDPQQMRRDLEPWARAKGGLMKDTLDEVGIDPQKIIAGLSGGGSSGEPLEQRLRGLHALYKDGILSEEEYLSEKQDLLDGE